MAEEVKASWPFKPPSPSCQMYKHLSPEERYQIHGIFKAKRVITAIARSWGRCRRTISHEFSRGLGQRSYRAEQACDKSFERAQRSHNACGGDTHTNLRSKSLGENATCSGVTDAARSRTSARSAKTPPH